MNWVAEIISYLVGDAKREVLPLPPVVDDDNATTIIEMNTWWPIGTPFADMMADVNDTVVFSWTAGFDHNVYLHPTGTCNETDAIFVGDAFPVLYTFTPQDKAAGSITFACDVSQFLLVFSYKNQWF